MSPLGNRIRDLRFAKGWGPNDLSKRAKISRTALYHLESGRTEKPQAATLRRIAKALGVDPEVLLGEGALSDDPSSASSHATVKPTAVSVGTPEQSRDVVRLMNKFLALLASPMAEGIARIIDESYRLIPLELDSVDDHSDSMPPATSNQRSRRR